MHKLRIEDKTAMQPERGPGQLPPQPGCGLPIRYAVSWPTLCTSTSATTRIQLRNKYKVAGLDHSASLPSCLAMYLALVSRRPSGLDGPPSRPRDARKYARTKAVGYKAQSLCSHSSSTLLPPCSCALTTWPPTPGSGLELVEDEKFSVYNETRSLTLHKGFEHLSITTMAKAFQCTRTGMVQIE
jgi:hypothetical protein